LYELATPGEQAACSAAARRSLRDGGFLYLDTNHMDGPLDPAWHRPGVSQGGFPSGVCAAGTVLAGTTEVIWFSAEERLVRFRRTVVVRFPDGTTRRREWIEQKHPPSTAEMLGWLAGCGFRVEHLWGDRARSPYSPASGRAVIWARAT
ncbi:MAG: hypothetical protein ABIL09_27525, partial [Gemmatimonadota bacterium]